MLATSHTDNSSVDFLSDFCRHIIGLAWTDARTEPDGPAQDPDAYDPRVFCVSAFVVSVRDIWFLVTAGHILRDLEGRLQAGRRILHSKLIDALASPVSPPPIPFTLGETPQSYVCVDGFDYGLIPLRPAFVDPLRAGGVVALAEKAWADIPDAPDGHFLLGFPSQAIECAVTSHGEEGNVNVKIATPLLPIHPVHDPPRVLQCSAPRFYGRVPVTTGDVGGRTVTLTDIDGMSGGPIFAVKRIGQDRYRYWVVAVQSSWERKSRVLAACLIQPLFEAIARCIDGNDGELERHEVDVDLPEYGA